MVITDNVNIRAENMILNKDSHSGEMVRAKKYEKYANMTMNNPREKIL